MTSGQMGVVAGVLHLAAHNVVAVVALWDVILGIHTDLWGATRHMHHLCAQSDFFFLKWGRQSFTNYEGVECQDHVGIKREM